MDKLLDIVFDDADEAHRRHLSTRSFSEHMALAEFYAGAREAIDAIVEAGIGFDVAPPMTGAEPFVTQLEESCVALRDVKEEVCQGESTLENLFDNLLGVYAKALYKLKRLS